MAGSSRATPRTGSSSCVRVGVNVAVARRRRARLSAPAPVATGTRTQGAPMGLTARACPRLVTPGVGGPRFASVREVGRAVLPGA